MTENTAGKTPVTVLGLGLMGSALARALLAAGHPTTVWNRTAAKAAPLAAEGATVAATAAEAVAANRLVIVCLSGYADAEGALPADALTGRTIVQLTSGTPAEARALASRLTGYGARYVDGGIMAVPPMIGGPAALILYSGDEEAFTEHREVLGAFGTSRYLGAEPGHAPLFDLALLDAMYGMLGGFYHAVALVRAEGVKAATFAPMAAAWVTAMTQMFEQAAKALDNDEFATQVSTVTTSQVAFPALIGLSRELGVDPSLLLPMRDLLDRAVAAGHGNDGLARLVTVLESPAV